MYVNYECTIEQQKYSTSKRDVEYYQHYNSQVMNGYYPNAYQIDQFAYPYNSNYLMPYMFPNQYYQQCYNNPVKLNAKNYKQNISHSDEKLKSTLKKTQQC